MTLVEIKKAIADRLKAKIPDVKVVAEEVIQGFKPPAFFIELLPDSKINVNPSMFDRSITVIINFFSVNETQIELLKMQDQLETVFDLSLTVNNRTFTIDSATGSITDKVLHFSFDLAYTDSREQEDLLYMENLNLKEGYTNGSA